MQQAVAYAFEIAESVQRTALCVCVFVVESELVCDALLLLVQDRGQPLPAPPDTYHNVIRGDKEHVINIVVHLVEGLAGSSAPIQACIEHFEKRSVLPEDVLES